MAKNGWKLSKVALLPEVPGRFWPKNGRKWVLANQIRPTLSAAIVFKYIRFWPKKHRELPFLAIVPVAGSVRTGVSKIQPLVYEL